MRVQAHGTETRFCKGHRRVVSRAMDEAISVGAERNRERQREQGSEVAREREKVVMQ